MATFNANLKDLAGNITLEVKLAGSKQWEWRLRVAGWLIRLAAWVAWMDVEIETEVH